jgi:hypothetical protein
MHYNFCRIHKSLRVTPAMAAGVADHVWDIADLAELLEPKCVTTDFHVDLTALGAQLTLSVKTNSAGPGRLEGRENRPRSRHCNRPALMAFSTGPAIEQDWEGRPDKTAAAAS